MFCFYENCDQTWKCNTISTAWAFLYTRMYNESCGLWKMFMNKSKNRQQHLCRRRFLSEYIYTNHVRLWVSYVCSHFSWYADFSLGPDYFDIDQKSQKWTKSVSDRSSRAENWTDLRKITMRIFLVRKMKKVNTTTLRNTEIWIKRRTLFIYVDLFIYTWDKYKSICFNIIQYSFYM